MALKTTKEIWDYLKEEYTGDERIRGMKVLNLIREFELQKMKESEIIKEYSDRLLGIVNKRPDAQCKICNQLGHEAVICKNKSPKYEADAQVANEEEEEHLFVATYFSTKKSDFWMIDSGCTNHMTYDINIFKEFMSMENKEVRIENGDYILAKGKGTIATKTGSVEKGFKLLFDDKYCRIFDATKQENLRVKMRGKNFSYNPIEDEHMPENCKTKDELADLFTKSIPANF
ncbi:uncharacterized protein LOC132601344 [Lycium barbarum]|uniref:uncharacterized protein LOC132601344 n=1 Tax=Lycium barbarum TaxID=112863 RepID=UPI00293F33CE|nr:uncharacterized protein LOC132601344 [Lycium barbarum]